LKNQNIQRTERKFALNNNNRSRAILRFEKKEKNHPQKKEETSRPFYQKKKRDEIALLYLETNGRWEGSHRKGGVSDSGKTREKNAELVGVRREGGKGDPSR